MKYLVILFAISFFVKDVPAQVYQKPSAYRVVNVVDVAKLVSQPKNKSNKVVFFDNVQNSTKINTSKNISIATKFANN